MLPTRHPPPRTTFIECIGCRLGKAVSPLTMAMVEGGGSWLREFEQFSSGGGGGGGVPPGIVGMGPSGDITAPLSVEDARSLSVKQPTKKSKPGANMSENGLEELQAEMKLLEWHKLANEAALKAALIRTKKLKQMERSVGGSSPKQGMTLKEKAGWMAQVIEDEQRKPLTVSKEFMSDYEAQERLAEERLEGEVQRHIEVLQTLKKKVQQREEIRTRHSRYKEQSRVLKAEKEKLLASGVSRRTARTGTQRKMRGASSGHGGSGGNGGGGQQVQSTLNTVISSLDKLVDLEKRISSLENDSLYERLNTKPHESAPAPRKTTQERISERRPRSELTFTKKRSLPAGGTPAKTYYSVRVTQKPRGVPVSNSTSRRPVGRPGAALARQRRKQANDRLSSRARPGQQRNASSSTFMTGVPESSGRRGNNASSSRTRTGRVARGGGAAAASVRRGRGGDDVVGDYMRRREKRTGVGASSSGRAARGAARGAASGRKYASKQMQNFHEMRGQMERRKGEDSAPPSSSTCVVCER